MWFSALHLFPSSVIWRGFSVFSELEFPGSVKLMPSLLPRIPLSQLARQNSPNIDRLSSLHVRLDASHDLKVHTIVYSLISFSFSFLFLSLPFFSFFLILVFKLEA